MAIHEINNKAIQRNLFCIEIYFIGGVFKMLGSQEIEGHPIQVTIQLICLHV